MADIRIKDFPNEQSTVDLTLRIVVDKTGFAVPKYMLLSTLISYITALENDSEVSDKKSCSAGANTVTFPKALPAGTDPSDVICVCTAYDSSGDIIIPRITDIDRTGLIATFPDGVSGTLHYICKVRSAPVT